jgi:hypothetical protein
MRHSLIRDLVRRQFVRKHCFVVLRVVPRTRDSPNIDDQLGPSTAKQVGELGDGPRGMAYSKDWLRVRHRRSTREIEMGAAASLARSFYPLRTLMDGRVSRFSNRHLKTISRSARSSKLNAQKTAEPMIPALPGSSAKKLPIPSKRRSSTPICQLNGHCCAVRARRQSVPGPL